MKTKVTELLGIKYPIIQGGLQWLGKAELASAVSNAGGLGTINALSQPDVPSLVNEIRKTQSMTDKPFAVNISMIPGIESDTTAKMFQAVVDEGVKAVETSGKSPAEYLPLLKKAGVKVIHKVASVRHAVKAAEIGVDLIEIIGFESGGHPGLDDVPTSILIPKAVDVIKTPIIAGGGIADGRGLAAALAWGAEGVLIGTRFVATAECPIHDNFKQWMVKAEETDTAMIQYTIRNPLRALKNKAVAKVMEMESKGATLKDLMPIIGGANSSRSYREGDTEGATCAVGQAVGMIRKVMPVRDVIEEIMADARRAIARLAALENKEAVPA